MHHVIPTITRSRLLDLQRQLTHAAETRGVLRVVATDLAALEGLVREALELNSIELTKGAFTKGFELRQKIFALPNLAAMNPGRQRPPTEE